MTNLCFVSTRAGNHFITEVLEAVAATAAEAGVRVSFAFDGYPSFDEPTAYVLIPHEFFVLVPKAQWPDARQLRRTIAVCVEMPGTLWFERTAAYASHAGATVAINRSATVELRRRGLAAEHLQLGYCRTWDTWGGDPAQARPLDVVYLGSKDDRRARVLAGFGEHLWARRTSILVPPHEPKPASRPDYLIGADKYARLRAARVLLNLHRGGATSFEWIRVLEAVCNGCVVVSEHSSDHAPLVPGEHFVSGRAESLAVLADHLLDDEDRLSGLRRAAYEFARESLRMEPAVHRLLEIAEGLPAPAPPGPARAPAPAGQPAGVPAPAAAPAAPPADAVTVELGRVRAALKQIAIHSLETRRLLQDMRAAEGPWDADGVRLVAATPAAERGRPRVSVIVPLYNQASEVIEALGSIAASEFEDREVLVYDDASTDESASAVERFFAAHPWLPGRLFQGRVNSGPGRGRNVLVARARGELVFMLDADNKVYPSTLGRLVEALDADPGAMFAYPIVAAFTADAPVGLLSALPWEPARLRHGNYIDTMALVRRATLLEMGGYAEDPRIQGWEDYDLWCRCAVRGHRGLLVPEILGWYRKTEHSMLSLATIHNGSARSLIRERSPAVFRTPVGPPRRPGPAPARAGRPAEDAERGGYPARGKIAIFGAYKTGTTALFYRIRNSLPAGTRTLFEPRAYVAAPGDGARVVLAKVILSVPEGGDAIRYDTFLDFDRKVYLVRDPRDWIVSGTLFAIQQDPHVYADDGKLAEIMALLGKKERDPRSVPVIHLLARILDANPDKSLERTTRWMARQFAWMIDFEARLDHACRVRYEDLVTGPLPGLERYLEVTLAGAASVDPEHAHVPRTRGSGDWRHWFTPDDVAYFQPVLAAYMRHYEYPADWRLADAPVIRPAHCTEYVARVVARRRGARA